MPTSDRPRMPYRERCFIAELATKTGCALAHPRLDLMSYARSDIQAAALYEIQQRHTTIEAALGWDTPYRNIDSAHIRGWDVSRLLPSGRMADRKLVIAHFHQITNLVPLCHAECHEWFDSGPVPKEAVRDAQEMMWARPEAGELIEDYLRRRLRAVEQQDKASGRPADVIVEATYILPAASVLTRHHGHYALLDRRTWPDWLPHPDHDAARTEEIVRWMQDDRKAA